MLGGPRSIQNNGKTLILDSRVLRDQYLNERRQQRFASLADVVHELEETQVDGRVPPSCG